MKTSGSICDIVDIKKEMNELIDFLDNNNLIISDTCELDVQKDDECIDFTLECQDTPLDIDHILSDKRRLPAKLYVPAWKSAGENKPFPKPARPKFDPREMVELEGSIHKGGKDSLEDIVPTFTYGAVQHWGDALMADVKYRGNRGLVVYHDGKVELYSSSLERHEKLERKYASKIASEIPADVTSAVFDAEFYVLDDGIPVEQGLQTGFIRTANKTKCGRDCKLKIEVFDVPIFNDKDIREESIMVRKRIVDSVIDNKGILQSAEMNYIPNSLSSLKGQLIEDRENKREGSVIKRLKPQQFSEYFIGKDGTRWIKQKVADTIDLRLKRLELYPDSEKQLPFGYRRLILVPDDDDDMEIPVANPITGMYNDRWWIRKTADLYDRAVAEGWNMSSERVRISDNLKGRLPDKLPKWIEVPKDTEVVEIYAEDISESLGVSSPRLVAFRGRKRAEKKKDLELVRRIFY